MRRATRRLAALAAGLMAVAGSLAAQGVPADVRQQIENARQDPNAIPLPAVDSFTVGPRVVAAGTTVSGAVAVARGDLEIRGVVDGDAVAVQGDVVVLPGGHVRGNAFSALGRVRLEGGLVDGEVRALGGTVGPVREAVAQARAPQDATLRAMKLAIGWLAVLTMIGIGVLVFAGSHLDGVADELERGVLRSFWTGLGGQLLALPVLLVLVVALAVTVIGVLLVPFAIVAYCIAVSGLLTLGFLATAHVTGRSLTHGRSGSVSERGGALRALVIGVVLFMALWVVAAGLTFMPTAATAVRALALVLTWVVTTAGFGAAIRSRAGTRSPAPAVVPSTTAPVRPLEDSLAWSTPTPVGGVVAARRPTPAPTGYDR